MKSKQATFRGPGPATFLAVALCAVAAAAAPDPGMSPQDSGPGMDRPAAGPADPMAEALRTGRRSQVAAAAIQAPAAAAPRTHLHCVFNLKKDGTATLVRAVEMEGDPLIPEASAGPLVSEVSKGDEVVSARSHVDPFQLRAFAPPEDKARPDKVGHHFSTREEGQVVVKIPGASLDDADLDKLAVRIYNWRGKDAEHEMNPGKLSESKRLGQVRHFSEVPAGKLGAEIRRKGIRARK